MTGEIFHIEEGKVVTGYLSGWNGLLWQKESEIAWKREDGIIVIRHESLPVKWRAGDSRVHPHIGWCDNAFEAMRKADQILPNSEAP